MKKIKKINKVGDLETFYVKTTNVNSVQTKFECIIDNQSALH